MALLLHLLLFLLCFWAGRQGCGKLESVFGPGQGLWLVSGPDLLGWVSLNRPQPQPLPLLPWCKLDANKAPEPQLEPPTPPGGSRWAGGISEVGEDA